MTDDPTKAAPDDLVARGRKLADDMERHATDEWDESELVRALLARIEALTAEAQEMGAGMVTLSHDLSMERAARQKAEAERDAAIIRAKVAEAALVKAAGYLDWCAGLLPSPMARENATSWATEARATIANIGGQAVSDASERIWVDFEPRDWPSERIMYGNMPTPYTEYTRADLIQPMIDAAVAQMKAERDAAVELLSEARIDLEIYITNEYPKDEHPYYARQWAIEMELCRKIDATIAKIKEGSHD